MVSWLALSWPVSLVHLVMTITVELKFFPVAQAIHKHTCLLVCGKGAVTAPSACPRSANGGGLACFPASSVLAFSLTSFPFNLGGCAQAGRLLTGLSRSVTSLAAFPRRTPRPPGGSCCAHAPAGFSPRAAVSQRAALSDVPLALTCLRTHALPCCSSRPWPWPGHALWRVSGVPVWACPCGFEEPLGGTPGDTLWRMQRSLHVASRSLILRSSRAGNHHRGVKTKSCETSIFCGFGVFFAQALPPWGTWPWPWCHPQSSF